MLPAATHHIWCDIATGKRPCESTKLSISLLEKNNRMSLARDQSADNVARLTAATYEFFIRYEKLLADEFARILA